MKINIDPLPLARIALEFEKFAGVKLPNDHPTLATLAAVCGFLRHAVAVDESTTFQIDVEKGRVVEWSFGATETGVVAMSTVFRPDGTPLTVTTTD